MYIITALQTDYKLKIKKMTNEQKFNELKELNKIEKSKLTDEQKARIKELLKDLASTVLKWLLNIPTLGATKSITKK